MTDEVKIINDMFIELGKSSEGIYYSGEGTPVSYPNESGNALFEVEEESFWFSHRNKVIHAALKQQNAESFVVDIGGGNGIVSDYLKKQGTKAILVEPRIDAVRNAQQRGLEPVVCGIVMDNNIRPETIPNAGMFDVLEHIENDSEFLDMLYGKMMPGGRLFITVPSSPLLWSQEDADAGHYRRYTEREIRTKLKCAGFRVEYCSHFFCVLPIPIFVKRTLVSFLRLKGKGKGVNDHLRTDSLLVKAAAYFLKFEVDIVGCRKTIPFGSSIIAVASKDNPIS